MARYRSDTVRPVVEASLFSSDEVGGPPTLTVGELSARIARLTATAFPGDLWVEGQMRNLSRSANGHAYFDLAEPTPGGQTPRAQVSVTLLAPERKHVNDQLTRAGGAVRMEDGIEVRIAGRLRWYTPRGTLQLRMHGIDPAFTLGRLHVDRERVLAALRTAGLLDANAAHALPLVPLRIGLLTSRGTAAHADALAELTASGIGFTIREVDARTQGAGCEPSITRGLRRLVADGVELILLVRGGGARTDLAAFDSEVIARAIAATPVPVLTGIGHEVDRSIADEVAHTAYKTPTAAASAIIERVHSFLLGVEDRWTAARRAARATATSADARLDRRAARIGRATERSLVRSSASLDAAARRTAAGSHRVLDRADRALDAAGETAARRANRALARTDRHLDAVEARARIHDPAHALARGWTITTLADGRPVTEVAGVAAGTELITQFATGTIASTVDRAPPLHRPKQRPRFAPRRARPGSCTMTDPTPVAELTYAEALAELEVILGRLEHDEPDVDRVAADVTRAAETGPATAGSASPTPASRSSRWWASSTPTPPTPSPRPAGEADQRSRNRNRQPSSSATRQLGSSAARQLGSSAARQLGSSAARQLGGMLSRSGRRSGRRG